jgi:hypothetical protein
MRLNVDELAKELEQHCQSWREKIPMPLRQFVCISVVPTTDYSKLALVIQALYIDGATLFAEAIWELGKEVDFQLIASVAKRAVEAMNTEEMLEKVLSEMAGSNNPQD